jgi:hypothetical protein
MAPLRVWQSPTATRSMSMCDISGSRREMSTQTRRIAPVKSNPFDRLGMSLSLRTLLKREKQKATGDADGF